LFIIRLDFCKISPTVSYRDLSKREFFFLNRISLY